MLSIALSIGPSVIEGLQLANIRDVIVEETGRKFGDALEAVQQAAAEVLRGFRSKLAPDELELAFGLKFSGKVGVVLASTDAEATFTLKAKWANKAQA